MAVMAILIYQFGPSIISRLETPEMMREIQQVNSLVCLFLSLEASLVILWGILRGLGVLSVVAILSFSLLGSGILAAAILG